MAHRVSQRAEADLDDIWYYVAKESGSIEIASRLIDSITNRFFLLASHPHLGRSRDDDFGAGSRSFPVGDYVIVYWVENGDLLIQPRAPESRAGERRPPSAHQPLRD